MRLLRLIAHLPPSSWLAEVARSIDEAWDLGDPLLTPDLAEGTAA